LLNYWPFNGDYSDYASCATLTPSGTVSFVPDHNSNAKGAVYLNGAYLSLPTQSYVTGVAFSFLAWVYLFNSNWLDIIVFGNGASSDNVYLGTSANCLSGYIYNGANGFNFDSAAVVTYNTWFHAAFTFDGVHAKLYVNGVFQGSTTSSVAPRNVSRSKSFIGINSWLPTGNNGFMKLDELRIYNRAVSVTEIQSIMTMS
jgi:hypothetical protein